MQIWKSFNVGGGRRITVGSFGVSAGAGRARATISRFGHLSVGGSIPGMPGYLSSASGAYLRLFAAGRLHGGFSLTRGLFTGWGFGPFRLGLGRSLFAGLRTSFLGINISRYWQLMSFKNNVRVREIDMGYRELMRRFRNLGWSVRVGWFPESMHTGATRDNKTPVETAAIVYWNEWGTSDGHTPARPFIRPVEPGLIVRFAELAEIGMVGYLRGWTGPHQMSASGNLLRVSGPSFYGIMKFFGREARDTFRRSILTAHARGVQASAPRTIAKKEAAFRNHGVAHAMTSKNWSWSTASDRGGRSTVPATWPLIETTQMIRHCRYKIARTGVLMEAGGEA